MLAFWIIVAVLAVADFFMFKRGGLTRLKGVPRYLWVIVLGLLSFVFVQSYFSSWMSITATIEQEIFLTWTLLTLLAAIGPLARKVGPINAQNLMPPPWPPRQPADWGRDLQVAYQRQVKRYHRRQTATGPTGINVGSTPPMMPMIPSWEAHYAAKQASAPLQTRWAQTDTGDWLRVIYGNRMRPPPTGQPMPVFQIMQRKEDGQWIWLQVPAQDFGWQQGPARIEEYTYSDAKGRPHVASRPCGHPGFQVAFELPEDAETFGSSRPLSDAELAAMHATHQPAQFAGPQPGDMPSPQPATTPQPVTHGSSKPLSDEDLG